MFAGLLCSQSLWGCSAAVAQEEPAFVLQNGHSNSVHSVAFSPDGQTLVSGSGDHTVKVWEVATGTLVRTLEGHSNSVHSVAFSPDGQTLATGGVDSAVKGWEVATGTLVGTLEGRLSLYSVAFSPDGQTLATGSLDHTVQVWEVATGKLVRTLEGHSNYVYSVAFSPDGQTLVSGSWDHTVKVWEVATGKLVRTLEGHTSYVYSVAFSSDGQTLASGSGDHTVKVWEVATGALVRTLEGYTSYVYSVAFSPDGQTLATGSGDHTVKVWEVATGTLVRTLEGHTSYVYSVAFSPDGQTLASGSGDHTVKVWEVATGALVRTLEGHSSSVSSVAFSPDGQTLASGRTDNTVKIWEVTTGTLVRSLEGHNSSVYSVAFSPDGQTLASGSKKRTIKVWEVATGALVRTLEGHSSSVSSVAFSPDGQTLASGSGDRTVKIWEVATGTLVRTLEGHSSSVSSVAFSPDGQTLVSGSGDHTVKIWEVATGTLVRTLEGHSSSVSSVAFSPDGQTLASGSGDHTVKVWEVATGKLVRTLEKYSTVSSMAFSPDGQTLRQTFKIHSSSVSSVAFSPDGQTLASGSRDHTLRVWEVATGKLVRRLEGHSNSVTSVAFSPDGQTLASGSRDTSLRRWRLMGGDLLAISYAFDEDYLTYTPEGLYVASEEGEKLAAWRLGNEVYGFEQYAERFQRPDLVAQRLAGRTVEMPEGVRIAIDRPPTLRWLKPFRSTVEANVRLVLTYEGTSELEDLILVFNNDPIRFDVANVRDRLEIPLTLRSRKNHLVAFAFDRKRLKSEALKVKFEYLGGSQQNTVELSFTEALPLELLDTDSLRLNHQAIDVVDIDPEGTLRFLGDSDLVRPGVNWIETVQGRFRFWWEEQKLLRMPDPYERSYAILAAIDDYEREKDPRRGPTGFEPLEDMVSQAQELEAALVEIGFPQENIVALYEQDATSTKITRELQRFWEGEELSGVDRLFFYFGGHGAGPEGHGYLITYDYDPQRPPRTSFLMSDIVSRHFPHLDVKHVLVALDSCSSGLAIPGFQALDDLEGRRLRRFRNLTVVLGDTQQKARNLLVAGTGEQRALYMNGGIFTRALVDSLQGRADWNSDGVIQFEELAVQLRNAVRDQALRTGVQQVPGYYIGSAHGNGKVLFLTP